jgi:hypothetical protein
MSIIVMPGLPLKIIKALKNFGIAVDSIPIWPML